MVFLYLPHGSDFSVDSHKSLTKMHSVQKIHFSAAQSLLSKYIPTENLEMQNAEREGVRELCIINIL